jgi:hypothetical protein
MKTAPQLLLLMCYTSAASADILNFQGISGEIGYQYSSLEADQNSMHGNRYEGSINTKGYLWQPWFITSSAGLIIALDDSESNNGANSNQLYAGNLNLNALPLSLYPFNLHLAHGDSYLQSSPDNIAAIASGTASLSDHQTTDQLSVVQSILGKRSRTDFLYNTTDTSTSTRDDNSVSYGMTNHINNIHHSFDFSANASETESNEGIASNGGSARAAHRYRASDRFDIYSEATSSSSQYSRILPLAAESFIADTNINQAFTSLNYRSTDHKLNSNASLRYLDFKQEAVSNNVPVDSFTTSTQFLINNNYNFTDYISGSLGGGASTTSSESGDTENTNGNIGVSMHTPIFNLLDHDYSANNSISTSFTQSADSHEQITSGSIGHNIQKSISIARRTALRYSLGQSYAYSKLNTDTFAEESIAYDVSSSLSHTNLTSAVTASASYNQTDSLVNDDKSYSYNISALLDNRLSNHSSANVTLGEQGFYGQYSNVISQYSSQSAKINYTFSRRFDFSVVTFRSEATISQSETDSSTTKNTYWRNNLSYVIGKVNSSIDYQLQQLDGNNSYLLYLNIKRSF